MIWVICRISMLRLWNNKHELALVFLVPILFFSIFALIFSRGVGESVTSVQVSFVDDDQTEESQGILASVAKHPEIHLATGVGQSTPDWPIDLLARTLISRHGIEVVVHIPAGFTTQDPDAPTHSIELFDQGINPIGHRLVEAGLAEAIAMQLAEVNLDGALENRPIPSATVSSSAQDPNSTVQLASYSSTSPSISNSPNHAESDHQVFRTTNAFASNKSAPRIAMYAAGIAVMFLLFSASGTGASLLEEREAGTLGRLLSTQISFDQLLLGKWIYATGLGCVQVLVMFAWAQLVFGGVDIASHWAAFALITFATAAASASFALLLAVLCRSRQQLQAISLVAILSMSAIGGSMVPRYIMSDSMKQLGKFTFNGWALDGYQKVFWFDLPASAIRTEVCVLLGMALLLGLMTRLVAAPWSRGVQL